MSGASDNCSHRSWPVAWGRSTRVARGDTICVAAGRADRAAAPGAATRCRVVRMGAMTFGMTVVDYRASTGLGGCAAAVVPSCKPNAFIAFTASAT